MTEFHERSFPARFTMMGDKAEGAFEGVHPNAHRLGLNRPKLNMSKMTTAMRYTPDYLLESGAYEVMGFSSRGNASLKLKCEKIDALLAWNGLMPTYLWVYDSGKPRYFVAQVRDWAEACYQHAERLFFSDNNRPYWNLSVEHFPNNPVILELSA